MGLIVFLLVIICKLAIRRNGRKKKNNNSGSGGGGGGGKERKSKRNGGDSGGERETRRCHHGVRCKSLGIARGGNPSNEAHSLTNSLALTQYLVASGITIMYEWE